MGLGLGFLEDRRSRVVFCFYPTPGSIVVFYRKRSEICGVVKTGARGLKQRKDRFNLPRIFNPIFSLTMGRLFVIRFYTVPAGTAALGKRCRNHRG